jgi:hypothetical protein
MPVKRYHPAFLQEALGAVARQTSGAWELLVIGEPRDLGELERALGGRLRDRRVELVANEGRKLAGALNTGMRLARTDFVAILLADDLWAETAVRVLERAIETAPGVDFFHSSRQVVDERGRPLSSVHRARKVVALEDFHRSSPVKHLLCWRRDLALSFGGMDETLDSVGVDDYDFPWSMAEHGARFQAVPDCLYLYRDHRASFRLTTHLPLAHHKRGLGRIMAKHGASPKTIDAKLASAEASYLRQCLYRSRLDRWLKDLRGFDPRKGWRETYE